MKKVAIIDDESLARENLKNLIREYCPNIEVIGEAEGVESGCQLIQNLQPDAVFLDVAMQDGTGFDLLDRFTEYSFQVIFQTAFDEFAVKAFKYSAVDYLLKPVGVGELVKAVNKISNKRNQAEIAQQLASLIHLNKKKTFEKIVLNSNEGMHFVEIADIVRLQSDVNYTTFYLDSGERITVTKTIKSFEELLPENHFFRPHQSFIVGLQYVKKVLREDGGYALMKDGAKIPISRRKKDRFIMALQDKAAR